MAGETPEASILGDDAWASRGTERIGTYGGRVKEEAPLQGTTSRGASPNRVKSLGLREAY